MARTKEFDQDAVLLKAMRLFWHQGYEKTSMQELVTHMGIHKGSMYDTFGDKRSLYIKTLKRYSEMLEESQQRRMANTKSAAEAIRSLFDNAIRHRDENPEGCFMVNTAVELANHDAEARDWVQHDWARTEQLILDLIVEGQQSGEIPMTLHAERLAAFLNNALIGLRVMVKTTMDKAKLNQIIDMNMSVLK
ncbi:TetR/AcrR family transcriptional regulator [Paenibacillus sp. R14(2021)]|uniref:TetR/AcrR family transcriptional regulator n=1 Tax=Paenibacillus sp. R14(2021) TaxID=2859228 RepID=UPI001C61598E|nr:TetR/AcrR family transcriptional regulator [Paenibacillus sp. R14(2021)]